MPSSRIDDYPHQFSGGMRQRVLIAMALIGKPELLIADEPTTALDVSVQAQILRLIHHLVQEYELAVLLITHNLGVVAQLCTHVAVMYAGNIIESGTVRAVFKQPTHPYTRALLDAVPTVAHKRGELRSLPGSVPNLFTPPPGCRFAPRCPHAAGALLRRLPGHGRDRERSSGCLRAGAPSGERSGMILSIEHVTKTFPVRGRGLFGNAPSSRR